MAHTDHHGAPIHQTSEAAGHELSDANLEGAMKFMAITALLLAGCFGLVWVMYQTLASQSLAADVKPSPVSGRVGDRLPPLPRLQTLPVQDLATFKASEAASVDTWAWVDKSGGVAQIPVTRAIEILAERGLPVPPPVAQPPAAPAAAATPAVAAPVTPPAGAKPR